MKAEYLPSGSPDCPILRLFDFEAAEVRHLTALCLSLASGSAERADIPAEAVNGCRLTLRVGRWNEGVLNTDEPERFECVLTPDGWEGVAELAAPFCEEQEGQRYQWLDENSPVSLLLSPSGQW